MTVLLMLCLANVGYQEENWNVSMDFAVVRGKSGRSVMVVIDQESESRIGIRKVVIRLTKMAIHVPITDMLQGAAPPGSMYA